MSVISLKYSGGDSMPNIKPISDLRNYSEVLRDVTIDSPVFLTKMVEVDMQLWIFKIMNV